MDRSIALDAQGQMTEPDLTSSLFSSGKGASRRGGDMSPLGQGTHRRAHRLGVGPGSNQCRPDTDVPHRVERVAEDLQVAYAGSGGLARPGCRGWGSTGRERSHDWRDGGSAFGCLIPPRIGCQPLTGSPNASAASHGSARRLVTAALLGGERRRRSG